MSNTPHDVLARAVFSDLRQARAFFRAFLPKRIVRQIDFSPLKAESDADVDDILSERRSDRVFSKRMRRKLLLLYLLFDLSHFTDAELKTRVLEEATYVTLAMLMTKGRRRRDDRRSEDTRFECGGARAARGVGHEPGREAAA